MSYLTVLDLELDDWIDPSLSRIYSLPLCPIPFMLSTEFTDLNEEFRRTGLFPRWTPILAKDSVLCSPNILPIDDGCIG